jgi:hypothetical protein
VRGHLRKTGPGVDSRDVEYSKMGRVGFESITVEFKIKYRLNFNQIRYNEVHILIS